MCLVNRSLRHFDSYFHIHSQEETLLKTFENVVGMVPFLIYINQEAALSVGSTIQKWLIISVHRKSFHRSFQCRKHVLLPVDEISSLSGWLGVVIFIFFFPIVPVVISHSCQTLNPGSGLSYKGNGTQTFSCMQTISPQLHILTVSQYSTSRSVFFMYELRSDETMFSQ